MCPVHIFCSSQSSPVMDIFRHVCSLGSHVVEVSDVVVIGSVALSFTLRDDECLARCSLWFIAAVGYS